MVPRVATSKSMRHDVGTLQSDPFKSPTSSPSNYSNVLTLRNTSVQLREEPDAGKPHVRICEGKAEWPSYSTILKSSDVIAIATISKGAVFSGDKDNLIVEMSFKKIVKGDEDLGKHAILCPRIPTIGRRIPFPQVLSKDYTFVLFASKNSGRLIWQTSAHLFIGNDIENSLLRLDTIGPLYNYEVAPDIVTLNQIYKYINSKIISYQFSGKLTFKDSARVHNNSISLSMVFNEGQGSDDVIDGPSPMIGFRNVPYVKYEYGTIKFTFTENDKRPLVILGKITSFVESSTKVKISLQFSLEDPLIRTKKEFLQYLANKSSNHQISEHPAYQQNNSQLDDPFR